jgi:PAS domain S-box-containing protein
MNAAFQSAQGWFRTTALPLQVIGILSSLILALNFCLEILALLALERNHQLLLLALLNCLAVWAILEAVILRFKDKQQPLKRLLLLLTAQLCIECFRMGLVFWGPHTGIDRTYGIGVLHVGPLLALLPLYVVMFLFIGRELISSHTNEIAAAYKTIVQMEETALKLTNSISVGTYAMLLAPGEALARFTFMSRRFLELTGLDRDEAASDPLKAFACVHPDDYDEWLRLNAEAFAAKKAFFGETRLLLNDEVRWITAESSPRNLPDGSTIWEGVLIDITAQKQAETELRVAHERLLKTERELAAQTERERLLQEMHDGFGSQLATASLRLTHDELSREQMDGLLRECLDDLHLIVDTFNIDDNSLLEALENYHYRLRNRLDKLPIRFGWQLRLENCPSLDERVILQLLRILQEGINNALKHAQASRIDIEAQYGRDGCLQISVADDGIGLPAEAERRGGRGMMNMQGRARAIGAQIEWVDNQPGTRLILSLVLL